MARGCLTVAQQCAPRIILIVSKGRRRFDCAEHPGFTRSRHVVFRNTLRMSSGPGASEARVVDGVDHRARGLPLYRRCECLCAHRTHAYTKSKQSRYVIDCSRYIASQDSEDTCRLKVQRCTAMDWILIPAYCSAIPYNRSRPSGRRRPT